MVFMRGIFLIVIALFAPALYAADAEHWPPSYDIPRLDNITIDGDGGDWKDQGFRIEVLAPTDGKIVPSTDFDALVRLGWCKEGLLLLVAVVDRTPSPQQAKERLEEGDSVELFVPAESNRAGVRGKNMIHYVIAPGGDGLHPDFRYRIDDPAPAEHQAIKPTLKVAGRKTGVGYIFEALVGVTVEEEPTILPHFQIIVNDSHGAVRARHTWFPADDTLTDHNHSHWLALGKLTSAPVKTPIAVVYSDLRQSRITLLTHSDLLGQSVEVSPGPSLREMIASNDLRMPFALEKGSSITDRAGAYLNFPLPPLGRPYAPLNIYVDSKLIGRLTPVNIDGRRRNALAQIDLKFKPGVFSGDAFPSSDFADPAYARDLLGAGYTFRTTFYNADHESVEKPDKPGRYGAIVSITTDAGFALPPRLVTLFKLKEAGARERDLELHMELPPQIGIDSQVVKEQQPALAEHLTERFIDGFSAEPDAALLLAAMAESKPGEGRLAGRNSIWARDQRWWLPIKRKLGLDRYHYLVNVPDHYEQVDDKFPLILFLHGSGDRGDDLAQLGHSGPLKVATEDDALGRILRGHADPKWKNVPGFILVCPQCPAGEWWSAQQLADVLDEVAGNYRVDLDRVYITGVSMGGYGAWELAVEFPERFAAIVPICGAGSPED